MSFTLEPLEPRQLLAAVPNIAAGTSRLLFSQPENLMSRAQVVTLKNTGKGILRLRSVTLQGSDASKFALDTRGMPSTLAAGASACVKVAFKPTEPSVRGAILQIRSNDPDTATFAITLRGLGTGGKFESHEPSLQRILDTYQIPTSVGDTDPATNVVDGPVTSEDIAMPLLRKAGPGMVHILPLAAFCWEWQSIVATYGWYTAGTSPTTHVVAVIPEGHAQRISPKFVGAARFDPGAAAFGVYASWPSETHGPSFSEDAFNSWDTSEMDNQRKVRFYPYKKPNGKVVPNAYIVAMEESLNSDFQDAVFLIDNVKQVSPPAAPSRPTVCAVTATSVDLTWRDQSDNETMFLVERSLSQNGPYVQVGKKGIGRQSFRDSGLLPQTQYYYRIRSANDAGKCAPSGTAATRTLAQSELPFALLSGTWSAREQRQPGPSEILSLDQLA